MNGMVGGDVDQLHQLGDNLKLKQEDIERIRTTVSTALASTLWKGPARDRFEADWHNSFEPALRNMTEAFVAAGTECKTRATALHNAMIG